MTASRRLEKLGRNPLFRAQTTPAAVLDRDLVIRAVNPAYLAATGSSDGQLLSQPMFEAFPDNPATPEANSVANLQSSLERTLRRGSPDHMIVQRYDVPDRENAGRFITKVWVPVNAPLMDGDDIVGVLHRVDEVTSLDQDVLESLTRARDAVFGRPVGVDSAWGGLAAALREFTALVEDNQNLREALTSRATIDQAKGMVMLACGVGPDDAFAVLRTISMNTNVRLADVAAAMVYQATNGGGSVLEMIHSVGKPLT